MTFHLSGHMPMYRELLKVDLLVFVCFFYDVIAQNGPWPDTVTHLENVVHGPINKNQSSKSGGAIDSTGLSSAPGVIAIFQLFEKMALKFKNGF